MVVVMKRISRARGMGWTGSMFRVRKDGVRVWGSSIECACCAWAVSAS
jgi:hypothetical protein